MASTNKNLTDFFERNKYNLDAISQQSRGWYEGEVRKLKRQQPIPNRILKGDPRNVVTKVYPGRMYMFLYDPKGKETLPYYDKFPMVIPWKRTPGGFIGLNLHYLPYFYRVQLMDRLMMFATNKRMDEATRLKYTWKMIDGVAKFRAAKPCVKQYLYEHVRSQFRRIHVDDWGTAMLIPVERFEKASKEQVWQESLKRMRN